jgi:hypothetical protein
MIKLEKQHGIEVYALYHNGQRYTAFSLGGINVIAAKVKAKQPEPTFMDWVRLLGSK